MSVDPELWVPSGGAGSNFLRNELDRAAGRVTRFQAITPDDRWRGFRLLGFRPYGVYTPYDPDRHTFLYRELERCGAIDYEDHRLKEYFALQQQCDAWAAEGIDGHWTGQQALARSIARFRIARIGRRGGKSEYAANEGLGVALVRPRTWVWVCAPTMELVSRVFDIILRLIKDKGIETEIRRDSSNDKLVVLPNGSRIEGISLQISALNPGAAVDLAIIDEALYLNARAWNNTVLPPLADKRGGALIISSVKGVENWFTQQCDLATNDQTGLWALVQGTSWDNFYAFPQGRESPSLKEIESVTDPLDFLEEYGGVARPDALLVYPQWKDRVHVVENYAVNPYHPVTLAIDPSAGANEYAGVALQDFGDVAFVFDEFYEAGALAEDCMAYFERQPYASQIKDVHMDCASATEVLRWAERGFEVIPVQDKPKPEHRYPIHRRMLRDPARFQRLYNRKLAIACRQAGIGLGEMGRLPPEVQRRLAIQVEEMLAPSNLKDEDIAELRRCAHFFVARRCIHTIEEHRNYMYQRRQGQQGQSEKARDFKDHILDALGYWEWMEKRWSFEEDSQPSELAQSYIRSAESATLTVEERVQLATTGAITPQQRTVGFLSWMREQFDARPSPQRSYLREE